MRDKPTNGIGSLEKGVDLLFLFVDSSTLGVREIAERLDVPVSTAYRFVRTFRHKGLLEQDPVTRKYQLGLRLTVANMSTGGTDVGFEALGFTFGPVDPHDPLFRPATLPDGWTKEGSDHDMWSYVVDELGRRRVGVFYKAAFHDRHADMTLHSLYSYVTGCVRESKPIVTDDTWATREAVTGELRNAARQAQDSVDLWERGDRDYGPYGTTTIAKYIGQYTAERDKYQALITEYAGSGQ